MIDGGTVRLPELIGLSRALDLIITGRIVGAKEAHEMGLANRVVDTGTGKEMDSTFQERMTIFVSTAFGHALNLAREIVKFPQDCLRADRASAYHATFASSSLENSLQFEGENALHVLSKVHKTDISHISKS